MSIITLFYACAGAPTGQTPSQAPHSMQASGSISYLSAPSEIAPTGHSAEQAPHEMHSSEIAYAITQNLLIRIISVGKNLSLIYHHSIKIARDFKNYFFTILTSQRLTVTGGAPSTEEFN